MTRDDINRIIQENGLFHGTVSLGVVMDITHLEKFAALVAAAEREKLKHELLTLEKWKGMALAKDGDGRTVQEVEREAREAEREACAKVAAWILKMPENDVSFAIRERGAP